MTEQVPSKEQAQRYYRGAHEMQPNQAGDWVLYSEYERLQRQRDDWMGIAETANSNFQTLLRASSSAHEPRDDLWDAYGNDGMRHMESSDVTGGQTDEPSASHPKLNVLAITDAYESGFGHGKNLDELPNPYSDGTHEHQAYSVGYEEGERRRRVNGSSGYCNQGAHEHCTNLRQQCMCKCHSPTKSVCRHLRRVGQATPEGKVLHEQCEDCGASLGEIHDEG